jgi:hypothetical protein
MEHRYTRTRRGFVAGAAFVLSGCLGGDGEDCEGAPVEEGKGNDGAGADNTTGGADEPTGNATNATRTDETETETGGTTDEDLDLREANVVAVTFSEEEEGTYTFDVTLYHDDEGEDGYANRWQVESLEGDCLGRRVLTHPHGTRRFTRSETVETGDRSCVVVRGHDQTHGYGGRAVLVDLETAETRGVFQGKEPSPFDEDDCP